MWNIIYVDVNIPRNQISYIIVAYWLFRQMKNQLILRPDSPQVSRSCDYLIVQYTPGELT